VVNTDNHLCHVNDIPDGESKGFYHQGHPVIAIRKQADLFLYYNRCPHLSVPLEWQEDQFLNQDKSLIQCSTHGALFEINTGRCISGPCLGASLQTIPFLIKNDLVFIQQPISLLSR
jgi:nitrite reductase/ring-hydroxylating ferredoxin subunit